MRYYTLCFVLSREVLASTWKSAQTIAFRGINNHLILAITSRMPISPATMSCSNCLTWLTCRRGVVFFFWFSGYTVPNFMCMSGSIAWHESETLNKVKVPRHIYMTFTDSADDRIPPSPLQRLNQNRHIYTESVTRRCRVRARLASQTSFEEEEDQLTFETFVFERERKREELKKEKIVGQRMNNSFWKPFPRL